MKTTSLFKIAALLCTLTFLLFNCQNDDNGILSENIQRKNKFEKLFNTKLVSKQLNLGEDNIYVNWNQPNILELSKDEKSGTYQYSIELKESIINSSDLFVEKLIFKLIVSEKEDQVDFTILRYEPFKNSLNINPSEINLNRFSGMKFIFNKLGVIQDIYTYQNGDKIASFNENKDKRKGKYTDILFSRTASSEDFDDCTDLNGNPIENCTGSNDGSGSGSGAGGGGGYVLETTRNYTDWYNMCNTCNSSDGTIYYHTDGNKYIYIKTVYDGSNSRWVWVSGGGNRYIDFFDSRTGGGSRGPNFNANDQRNYSGSSNNETGDQLPCPIGYQKIGHDCVKIVDEEEQLNNELTNDCAKNIFNLLKNETPLGPSNTPQITTSFTLSGEILSLFDNANHINYTVRNDNIGGIAAVTNRNYPNVITTFSNNYLNNATTLSIARTMIHESVHAYILHQTTPPNIDGDFISAITEYAKKYGFDNPNRFHHEFMAQYINAMAYSLYTWDRNNGGGNLGWEYYKAMAYGGLFYEDENGNQRETDSFIILEPLQITRDNIKRIIENEQNGNQHAKGKKCN
ncbi:hypothetical protein [Tenacibaculum xiamenense]|uniref:hypothetical protein n=1 Tax=Tenacibaculum xiamenense TaxID=1261553 RepID=UPI003893D468